MQVIGHEAVSKDVHIEPGLGIAKRTERFRYVGDRREYGSSPVCASGYGECTPSVVRWSGEADSFSSGEVVCHRASTTTVREESEFWKRRVALGEAFRAT